MKISTSVYNFLVKVPVAVQVKKKIDSFEFKTLRARQVQARLKRKFYQPHPLAHSYRFSMLSVKRTAYIDFAINQINSLHYYNPYHVFDILCDDLCLAYFKTQQHRLDYPENTMAISIVKKTTQSWQHYKIEALLYAIQRDSILVDADMYWYTDPLIRQWQALFFAKAYKIKDQLAERKLVSHVFNHPKWENFPHYTTGVLYLPYYLFSQQLKKKLLLYVDLQTQDSFSFLKTKDERNSLRRLVDEMAINLAFQESIPNQLITTLKGTDSPGDRRIVLSLYYGSMNNIIS